ncbi:MAG: DUF3426 domain-containing protein [Steroidobacteraceae bacterium]
MFTQCPACETIFKLSAEVLRAAAGEVRCGRCGEVFNALRSLAEEPRAFTSGESAEEQEARADRILRSPPPEAPAATDQPLEIEGAPGPQIAQLEIQGAEEMMAWNEEDPPAPFDTPEASTADAAPRGDEPGGLEHAITASDEADALDVQDAGSPAPSGDLELSDDRSLEFTLPPGELDRIFVAARPSHFEPRRQPLALQGLENLAPASPRSLRPEPALAPEVAPDAGAEVPPADTGGIDDAMEHDIDAVEAPAAEPAAAPAAPVPGTRPKDWIGQIMPTLRVEDLEAAPAPHRGAWIAACILFAVLLLGQLAHQHRDALAQAPGIGPALRSLYQATGHPIPLQMNLAAFEVRQWGVTGDANASGTLRVRASLINTGPEPQPYPLLRLTLADRFGTRVGARDFQPAEYLRHVPPRPLDPGERADALIEIVDPGKSAEGFEIDVCQRGLAAQVTCANDSPAHAR